MNRWKQLLDIKHGISASKHPLVIQHEILATSNYLAFNMNFWQVNNQ